MNRAASLTIGLHDFGSFATRIREALRIREVKTAYWRRVPITPLVPDEMASHEAYRTPSLESGLVVFTIVADAFCPQYGALPGRLMHQSWFGTQITGVVCRQMAEPVREGSSGPIAPQGLTFGAYRISCR